MKQMTTFCSLIALPLTMLQAAGLESWPTTNVPVEDWQTAGNGTANNGVFVQEGRTAFSVSLSQPPSPNYLVRGEVLFTGPGASLTLSAGILEVNGKPVSARGTATLAKDKSSLRIGRTNQPLENATTTWAPFEISRIDKSVHISIAGTEASTRPLPHSSGGCSITLGRGAQLRRLTMIPFPSEFVPLTINGKANTPVTGKASFGEAGLAEWPGPIGELASFSGVPFLLSNSANNHAMDVSGSMSGLKEPIRLKYTYLHQNSINGNGRLVLPVPGGQYSTLHLVAFSANREGHVPRMTVTIGYFGPSSGLLEHQVVEVPRLNETGTEGFVAANIPVKLTNGKAGNLHYLKVPMAQSGNVREFDSLNLEFTRDINIHLPVPDPFEFGELPSGMPSDVIILGATLEHSPVSMTYTTAESGNVFSDEQKVEFHCTVTNQSEKPFTGKVFARSKGPGTGEQHGIHPKEWAVGQAIQLDAGETQEVVLDTTPKQRGWFACSVGVESNGVELQRRDTSFAVLAPDTRKALDDSPFGIWAFWVAHNVKFGGAKQIEDVASLIRKGGWRWTYGGSPGTSRKPKADEARQTIHRIRDVHKVTLTLRSPPHAYQRGEGWYDEAKFNEEVPAWLATARDQRVDNYYKVLHESRSSTDIVRRLSEFVGGSEYEMPEAEEKRLLTQIENVKKYCAALKKADPQAKIVLINDYPAVGVEYMKHKFPAELFDVWGSEGAMFMRQPERQPDWLCLLGQMHTWKRAQKKYGYDKPVWFTEALYHGTNPGNLSLHQQAVISVREAMLALTTGIERMASCGLIKDSTDDYRWSNWGSAGYCFREPEINPKPSYPMFAWLTQILDQAKPMGAIRSDSNVLHVLDFKKPDGTHVYPVWIVRGQHNVELTIEGGSPIVFDAYGNPITRALVNGKLSLSVSDTPLYVTNTTVTGVAGNKPVEQPFKLPATSTIRFAEVSAKPASENNTILESDWAVPRLKGSFTVSASTEDGIDCLSVELKPDDKTRKLLPRYVELVLDKPLALEGDPTQLSVRMKGNGGWGRIMFELVDAKGRVWTSSGNQYSGASNSSDNKATSWINFEGWNTITMPLPGQYPGRDQMVHRPHKFDWWPTNSPEAIEIEKQYQSSLKEYEAKLAAHEIAMKEFEIAKAKANAEKQRPPKAPAAPRRPRKQHPGHEPIDFPARLTKVIVSMRPHILYVNEERPVRQNTIFLDRLSVHR